MASDPRLRVVKHGHAVRNNGGHGESATYKAFLNARNRCRNSKHNSYKDYGARGIEFHFNSFTEWLKELGSSPGKGYSVDRINNAGHYEPGNVRWATRKEQAANMTRRYRSNVSARQILTVANRVYRAVKSGRIKRTPCEICGETKVEAHHEDYSRPLAVRWLCRPCHWKEERKKRQAFREQRDLTERCKRLAR